MTDRFLNIGASGPFRPPACSWKSVTGEDGVANHGAEAMLDPIEEARSHRDPATLIVPVAPFDPFAPPGIWDPPEMEKCAGLVNAPGVSWGWLRSLLSSRVS
ncbi:MAG: hypothetical protein ACQESR_15490 [Planctomycetota bacterium]